MECLPVGFHKFVTELWALIDIFTTWNAFYRGYSQIFWTQYRRGVLANLVLVHILCVSSKG